MQFGSYQSVRRLNQAGAATIYSARRDGEEGPPSFAIKHLELPVFWGPQENAQRISAFLSRATLQKTIAEDPGSSGHWAPIHEGPQAVEDGAWYVTNLYPRSAEDLGGGRHQSLDAAELYRVANCVVSGLRDLVRVAGRPHGNLKPGNVLICGRREKISAFLSDPLHDEAAARRAGFVSDAAALGGILCLLVLHRPHPPGAEVPEAPQWTALGRNGPKWRRLCERLLSDTDPITSLDHLSKELTELRPSRRLSPRVWTPIATVVAAVVLLAALLWPRRATPQDWRELCQNIDWADALTEALRDGDMDPSVRDELAVEVGRLYPMDEISPSLSSRGAYDAGAMPRDLSQPNIKSDLKAIRRLKQNLGQWSLAQRIVTWRAKLQGSQSASSQFTSVDAALTRLNGQPASTSDHPTIRDLRDSLKADIRTILSAGPGLKDDPDLADSSAKELRTRAGKIGGNGGEFLIALADRLSGAARHGELADLPLLHERAGTILLHYFNNEYLNNNSFAFDQIEHVTIPERAASAERWKIAADKWAEAANGCQKIQDPRDVKSWADHSRDFTIQIKRIEGLNVPGVKEAAASLMHDVSRLDALISKGRETPAIALQSQTIGTQNSAATELIKKLNDEFTNFQARFDIPVNWEATVKVETLGPDPGPCADALETLWGSERDRHLRLISQAGRSKEFVAVTALRNDLHTRSRALTPFDLRKAIQPASEEWMADLQDLLNGAQKTRFAGVIAGAQWVDADKGWGENFGVDWDNAIAQWELQKKSFVTIAKTARLIESEMDASGGMYLSNERTPDGHTLAEQFSGWWNEVQKQRATNVFSSIEGEFKRLTEACAGKGMAPDVALKTLPYDASLVRACWEKSGTLPLETERVLHEKLFKDLESCRPERHRELATAFANEFKRRLEYRIESYPAENELTVADELVRAWGIHDDQLNPVGRFNLALNRLAIATRDAGWDDARAKTIVPDFLSNWTDPGAAPRDAQAFLSKLKNDVDKAEKKRPDEDQKRNAGPDWDCWNQWVPGTPVQVAFGPGKNLKLEFRPVTVDGHESYLCTTEVSIEVFNEALSLSRANNQGGAELSNDLKPDGYSSAQGPQLWTLDRANARLIARNNNWIPDLALGLQAYTLGNNDQRMPNGRHPMVYLSFGTAQKAAQVLHCRLPTAAEWQDAFRQMRNAQAVWNLRGPAWAADRVFFDQKLRNQAFPGNADPRNWGFDPPGAAQANQQGYGHLFFDEVQRSAPAAPPPLFLHLVGNAAEFVLDDNKPSVIGGSVLSTPQIPFDKPQPLKSKVDREFVDVGFRLVIEPPFTSVAHVVQGLLKNPPYSRVAVPSASPG